MDQGTHRTRVMAYYLALTIANRIVANIPFLAIRQILLRTFFRMRIGKDTFLGMGIKMLSPWKIQIGQNLV